MEGDPYRGVFAKIYKHECKHMNIELTLVNLI